MVINLRDAMAERIKHIHRHLNGKTNIRFEDTELTANLVPFRYTLENKVLTYEQRKFYEENGYFVVRRLVPQEKLDVYRKRFEEICKREVTIPGLTIMRDVAIAKSEFTPGEQAVTKIQNFQNDDVMFEYCCLPEVQSNIHL